MSPDLGRTRPVSLKSIVMCLKNAILTWLSSYYTALNSATPVSGCNFDNTVLRGCEEVSWVVAGRHMKWLVPFQGLVDFVHNVCNKGGGRNCVAESLQFLE